MIAEHQSKLNYRKWKQVLVWFVLPHWECTHGNTSGMPNGKIIMWTHVKQSRVNQLKIKLSTCPQPNIKLYKQLRTSQSEHN